MTPDLGSPTHSPGHKCTHTFSGTHMHTYIQKHTHTHVYSKINIGMKKNCFGGSEKTKESAVGS